MSGRSATTTRVLNSLRRVRVERVDDSGDLQMLQVGEHSADVPDVPHALPYGLAVGLPKKAEGFLSMVGAAFDHVVAWGFTFARHRPRDLAPGDVTLYDGHGHRMDLTASGTALNCSMVVDGTMDAEGYKVGDGFTGLSGVVSIPTPGGAALLQFKGGILCRVSGTATLTPLIGA